MEPKNRYLQAVCLKLEGGSSLTFCTHGRNSAVAKAGCCSTMPLSAEVSGLQVESAAVPSKASLLRRRGARPALPLISEIFYSALMCRRMPRTMSSRELCLYSSPSCFLACMGCCVIQ